MSKMTITVTDESKRPLLKALFDAMDFVQYEEQNEERDYSAFEESFGMWQDTDITLDLLRSRAWKRTV